MDLLVRKSRELQDALRNAGGLQYAELQILEAQVSEVKATMSAKMATQAEQDEQDYITDRAREADHQVIRAAAAVAAMGIVDRESSVEEEGDGGGRWGSPGGSVL